MNFEAGPSSSMGLAGNACLRKLGPKPSGLGKTSSLTPVLFAVVGSEGRADAAHC